MWVIPSDRLPAAPFEPHESLFLDCWHGLTHSRSLDSHRVRCLNARTILGELCDELDSGRLDEPEFRGICEETLSLLQGDPIVPSAFSANLEYYLKQTLTFTLDALNEHPHVVDLASLFQRSVVMWERQLEALKGGGGNAGTIADAVFASVIARD